MDLLAYYEIIKSRWRIALIAFVVTLGATIAFTFLITPVYEAENTFVLRPRSSVVRDNTDYMRVLDTLSNREEINATVVEVANSGQIKTLAADRIGLATADRLDYSVIASVLAGTNLVSFVVQGIEPDVTKQLVDAVSIETANYINELYSVFQLDLLDESKIPESPIRPNILINLIVGVVMGIILSIGVVMLAEFLQSPPGKYKSINIIDNMTGAYNKPYLMIRLHEELARSRRNNYPFSLALLKIIDPATGEQLPLRLRSEILRQVFNIMKNKVRGEDTIFRIEGSTFAIHLPYMDNVLANGIINQIVLDIEVMSYEIDQSSKIDEIRCVKGLATFIGENIDEEQFLMVAIQSMYKESSVQDKVEDV